MILLVVLIPNDARGLCGVNRYEFTAKLLKLAPFGTTKPLANLAAMAFMLIFNLCYVNCQPLSEITAHGLGPIIDRDFGQRGKGIHGGDDDNAAFGLAEPSW